MKHYEQRMKTKLLSSIFIGALALTATAQSGTNSPYSQFGLGVLSEQAQGFNRGMNGLSQGLRFGNQVNSMNPASYSAVDSLTMIIDVGASGQITNFSENGTKKNAHNANFEYLVGAFRLMPDLGLSFGILPYTNVGYNYYQTSAVGTSSTTVTQTYSGSGGLHQAYLGLGWNVFNSFSVGANFSYLWGTYSKSVVVSYTDSYANTVSKTYGADIASYKLDFGAQWERAITPEDILTIGATVGIGHKLGADAELNITNKNTQTSVSTDSSFIVSNALSIPMTYGLGLAWKHGKKWTVGVDYSLQKWGSLEFPESDDVMQKYVMKSGLLKDRSKLTVGGEWIPNVASRNLLNRIRYRFGASYATSYYKVNGVDGPKEMSISAGFGIPITNAYNNRSVLNISGQWARSAATGLITENTFRINIGITFNEAWFMKWKFN